MALFFIPPTPDIPRPLTIKESCRLLFDGGVLVYPTETFFAIGCLIDNTDGIKKIAHIKKRNPTKPMPLLAASIEQVSEIADIGSVPPDLLAKFWPGPLTVLLPSKINISPLLANTSGKIAIRVSSGRLASSLAIKCGMPLAASSANISGNPPAVLEKDLDDNIFLAMKECGIKYGLLARDDHPNLTAPSTIVDILPQTGQLQLLREGAIPRTDLEREGFRMA